MVEKREKLKLETRIKDLNSQLLFGSMQPPIGLSETHLSSSHSVPSSASDANSASSSSLSSASELSSSSSSSFADSTSSSSSSSAPSVSSSSPSSSRAISSPSHDTLLPLSSSAPHIPSADADSDAESWALIRSTPAFQSALAHEQAVIRAEYEQRLCGFEHERQALEAEKAQLDKYKQLLLKQRDIMLQLTARLSEKDKSVSFKFSLFCLSVLFCCLTFSLYSFVLSSFVVFFSFSRSFLSLFLHFRFQILLLQEEVERYDRDQRALEDLLDQKTASLIALQKAAVQLFPAAEAVAQQSQSTVGTGNTQINNNTSNNNNNTTSGNSSLSSSPLSSIMSPEFQSALQALRACFENSSSDPFSALSAPVSISDDLLASTHTYTPRATSPVVSSPAPSPVPFSQPSTPEFELDDGSGGTSSLTVLHDDSNSHAGVSVSSPCPSRAVSSASSTPGTAQELRSLTSSFSPPSPSILSPVPREVSTPPAPSSPFRVAASPLVSPSSSSATTASLALSSSARSPSLSSSAIGRTRPRLPPPHPVMTSRTSSEFEISSRSSPLPSRNQPIISSHSDHPLQPLPHPQPQSPLIPSQQSQSEVPLSPHPEPAPPLPQTTTSTNPEYSTQNQTDSASDCSSSSSASSTVPPVSLSLASSPSLPLPTSSNAPVRGAGPAAEEVARNWMQFKSSLVKCSIFNFNSKRCKSFQQPTQMMRSVLFFFFHPSIRLVLCPG